MKKNFVAFIISLFTFFILSCNTGKKYDLRMRLAEGDHFEQNMQMDMRMHYGMMGQSMNMRMNTDIASFFDVQKSTPDEKEIKMTYSRTKWTMDIGVPGANTDSTINKVGEKMVGKSIILILSKDNEIKDVKGAEVFENNSDDPAAREVYKKMFSKEQMNSLFGMMFSIYPGKPVRIGQSWTKQNKVNMGEFEIKINTKYTLQGVNGNTAAIAVLGAVNATGTMTSSKLELEMKGTQKGMMYLDLNSGYLQKGNYNMAITANMNVMGQKIPITMDASYNMFGK